MLPVVCIFGAGALELKSEPEAQPHETNALKCLNYQSDENLEAILREVNPHVFVTVGGLAQFKRLNVAPFDVRRRWLHYADASDPQRMGREAFNCYLSVCLEEQKDPPLVSVFTPTYKTGQRFLRPYRSLLDQIYVNWEWVIWDDSDDNGETARMIEGLAAGDHRIRLIRAERHSGIIGDVKYNACMATRGQILVELDHDDELTGDCLDLIVKTWRQYPQCGFYYSDFAEVGPNLEPLKYGDGWGYGYGAYRSEDLRGNRLAVAVAPNINAKTIRSLVAAPNHVRAWRRDVYFATGGHNRQLHVADDMELMIRTFLETTMIRIPRLCYLQFQDGGNTQRVRNQDIQRHVRYLRHRYDRRIHDRLEALGIDDWIWNAEGQWSDMGRANPPKEPTASLTAELD
jgi:O-antigen biosynthesis protein